MRTKIVNLYGGPGTGKSTTALSLTAELKYRGVNCEYINEYAKDAAWENRSLKFWDEQTYIFAKQAWKISRVAEEVDILITDCPLLLTPVYMNSNFHAPSLVNVVLETRNQYDNMDIFLIRNKPYNPKGRLQTENKAKELDKSIKNVLDQFNINYNTLEFSRSNPLEIVDFMIERKWDQTIKNLINE